MKKNKIIIGAAAVIMAAGFLLNGCGAKPEPSAEPTPEATVEATPAPTPEPTPTPTPEYKIVGKAEDGAFEVLITNHVGQDIAGLAIKSSEDTEYPENLIPEGEVIKAEETVKLYYTPAKDQQAAETPAEPGEDERDILYRASYDVRLTCADGTTIDLYDFGFEDMKEADILFEDGVGFVKYVSVKNGEPVDTKEAQLAKKAQMEEDAKKEEGKSSGNDGGGSKGSSESTPKPAAKKTPEPAPKQDVEGCLDEDDIVWND